MIANGKVLFTLSFAAPDLRRPKAAYFPGKSVRIRVENGSLLVLWDTANGFPRR